MVSLEEKLTVPGNDAAEREHRLLLFVKEKKKKKEKNSSELKSRAFHGQNSNYFIMGSLVLL